MKQIQPKIKIFFFLIIGKSEYEKPFLFPHGNLKTDTLSRELGQYGISMEDVLVYDTVANAEIEKEIVEVTNNYQNSPEYIVFFSPSGLNSSIYFLKKLPDFDNVKVVRLRKRIFQRMSAIFFFQLIALGPTTELAMKEQGLKVYGVSKNPTPNDVLNLILLRQHYF